MVSSNVICKSDTSKNLMVHVFNRDNGEDVSNVQIFVATMDIKIVRIISTDETGYVNIPLFTGDYVIFAIPPVTMPGIWPGYGEISINGDSDDFLLEISIGSEPEEFYVTVDGDTHKEFFINQRVPYVNITMKVAPCDLYGNPTGEEPYEFTTVSDENGEYEFEEVPTPFSVLKFTVSKKGYKTTTSSTPPSMGLMYFPTSNVHYGLMVEEPDDGKAFSNFFSWRLLDLLQNIKDILNSFHPTKN
jgi:hypothetical protein